MVADTGRRDPLPGAGGGPPAGRGADAEGTRVNQPVLRSEQGDGPIQKPIAPARFYAASVFTGDPWVPELELWNLTEDIDGHCAGSTVTRGTLEAKGYFVPPAWKDAAWRVLALFYGKDEATMRALSALEKALATGGGR